MTPLTETTATQPASAIGYRPGGGEGAAADTGTGTHDTGTPDTAVRQTATVAARPQRIGGLLRWPTWVWLLGTATGAAGLFAAESVAAESSARGFLAVGAICYAATIASLLPIRNLASGPTAALPLGLLATIAIRGGTTLCLLIAAITAGWLERDSVALPIVLWYMAFLITDLVVVNRFLSEALPLSAHSSPQRLPRSERPTHLERLRRAERLTRSERTTC